MAGRIPQQFIDDLIARTDIVEVVDQRVSLKKAGRDYKACCPFHDEKTPSFTVSPGKQFYHCFGCGAHGTVVGFLMDYERMEFPEAIEELASRLGLEVPREGGPAATERVEDVRPLLDVLARASTYYQRQLRAHPEAQRVVAYLKGRGVSGATAAQFHLGFAPPGWDNLVGALGRDEASRRLLVAAGLAAERDGGGCYDRLRDRLVFPIQDRRGRTVGFGGRVLGDDTPKYLNSPETAVFHKGRELYGLDRARGAGRRPESLLVVEGYMDVLGLAEAGIDNAVATLGTAATQDHLEQLYRICDDVAFCFDGDEAGRRAAWRALETALPLMRDGRRALFVFLPEGEDPDSLVRARGADGLRALVDGATPLGTFLFGELASRVDLGTLEGRSRLWEQAHPLVARLPPGGFRQLMEKRLSEVTGIEPGVSSTLASGNRAVKSPGTTTRRTTPAGARTPVRRAITILVHYPELAADAGNRILLDDVETPGVPLLAQLIETVRASPNLTTGALLERFRDHESGRHLARLAAEECAPLSEGLRQEFLDCLDRLAGRAEAARYEALRVKARIKGLSAEEAQEFARLSVGVGPTGSRPEKG